MIPFKSSDDKLIKLLNYKFPHLIVVDSLSVFVIRGDTGQYIHGKGIITGHNILGITQEYQWTSNYVRLY